MEANPHRELSMSREQFRLFTLNFSMAHTMTLIGYLWHHKKPLVPYPSFQELYAWQQNGMESSDNNLFLHPYPYQLLKELRQSKLN